MAKNKKKRKNSQHGLPGPQARSTQTRREKKEPPVTIGDFLLKAIEKKAVDASLKDKKSVGDEQFLEKQKKSTKIKLASENIAVTKHHSAPSISSDKSIEKTSGSTPKRIYIPDPPPQKSPIKSCLKVKPTASPNTSSQKAQNLGLSDVTKERVLFDISHKTAKETSSKADRLSENKKSCHANRTQVHSGNPTDESDIVIGVDIGTSCTKVVIRDIGINKAYAIPFNGITTLENVYLLPTAVYVYKDGRLSLSKGDFYQSDLKLQFLSDPFREIIKGSRDEHSLNSFEVTAGYLALILKHAREWFLLETEEQYKNTKIFWYLNLGIPSRNYDDRNLRKQFEVMAQSAWFASAQEEEVSLHLLKNSFTTIREFIMKIEKEESVPESEDKLHPEYVTTHPEVIMEVVGYAKSPLRAEGAHLLIDVGASTLDTATFIITENDGEDMYPMLESRVEKRGTMMLHKLRMIAVKTKLEESINTLYNAKSTNPIPGKEQYQFNIGVNAIDEIDKDFKTKCREIVGDVLKKTKAKRDPNSHVWKSFLPVFLCGGGSSEEIYIDMVEELSRSLKASHVSFSGFRPLDIPMPDNLYAPEIPPNEYKRLAVAYGLSFSPDEIGEVVPESKVEDIQPINTSKDLDDRYISKDMC